MNDVVAGFIVLLVVFGIVIGAFLAGVSTGQGEERRIAITADVGRWTIDPKTGKNTFYYGPREAFP